MSWTCTPGRDGKDRNIARRRSRRRQSLATRPLAEPLSTFLSRGKKVSHWTFVLALATAWIWSRHSRSASRLNICLMSFASVVALGVFDLGNGVGDLTFEASLTQDALGQGGTNLRVDALGQFGFEHVRWRDSTLNLPPP